MIPQWFGDCFYNSDNVMWNMAAANSAAWACMSWASNPMVGGYSPYINFGTGCEYLTNPFYAWSQAGWNLCSGNNGPYDCQAPWTEMGWSWYQNNNNTGNKDKKEKEELSSDEKLAKVRYERLKKLLEDYSKNMAESGSDADTVNSDTLKSLLKKSDKTTWAEKFEELLAIYNNPEYIDKDDIKAFIIKSKTQFKYGLGTSTMTMHQWLKEAGYQYFASDYQDTAASIMTLLDGLSDKDRALSAAEVTSDKILGVLSYYNNGSEDFATAFINKYNGLTEPAAKDTALSSISIMVNALIRKAESVRSSDSLDSDTKDALTKAITAMSGQITSDNDLKKLATPNEFAAAFNKLYALTRLAAAAIAEKSLDDQYGSIDATIAKFVTEQTKKDLEAENLAGVTISDLNVKRIKSNTTVIKTNNAGSDINKKSNEEKIKTLVDGGFITEVQGAACDGEQVYAQTLYNGKTRWLILKDDGKFYHVVKVNDEYTVKDGEAGIEAKTIKDEGEKIEKRKEAEEELTTNDKAKLAQEKHQYTENGVNYAVYSIKIGEETHYYILNDDNKLQEVTVSGSTVTKKAGTALTLDDLKTKIDEYNKKAEEQRQNDAKLKLDELENPYKDSTEDGILVLDDFAIGQGNWSTHTKRLKQEFTNKLSKYKTVPEGFDTETWNAAYQALISYYTAAYKSMADMNWNTLYDEADQSGHTTIKSTTYYVGDKEKPFQDNNTYLIDGDDDIVNSYSNVKDGNKKSKSGLYVGCDWDTGYKCFAQIGFGIADGGQNDFYFYLDPQTVFEKFKEFYTELSK